MSHGFEQKPGGTSLVSGGSKPGTTGVGPGKRTLTGQLPTAGASSGRLPHQAEMQQAFGEDFGSVEVVLGDAKGAGASALASQESGHDVVAFDSTAPSREQVAHELTHVVQLRRFGAGTGGHSSIDDASEREARDLAPRAAAGEAVDVRAAPSARVLRDGDVAQNIYDKLHGMPFDDEAGALADLRRDTNRGGTCKTYKASYQVTLWADFTDNASGSILRQALALLLPHMTLLERLATHLGWDDDEGSILQTILNASNTEIATAGGAKGLKKYVDELDPSDGYRAMQRIQPGEGVANVVWLLDAGNGWIWDDEGPVATAIMGLSPAQRLELWKDHNAAFSMFNAADKATIGRMCAGSDGKTATNDATAASVRMELATDGLGTDEDGALAAVAFAGSRRDEQARNQAALDSRRGADGKPLTDAQRRELDQRQAEIGNVNGLLTPRAGEGGRLDDKSFLGRVQDDMDAGTLDAALTTAHAGALTRAKQALLMTMGDTGIDIDEDAALAVLRGVQGDVALAPGETIESLGPDEVRRRRDASAAQIRHALRADPDLKPVWDALDSDERNYADAITSGDSYATAIAELTRAFEGVDTDEAKILRIVRDMAPADRDRLYVRPPSIIDRIRSWPLANAAFLRTFETVLQTGQIPAEGALEAASGVLGAGTDEAMITDVLHGMSAGERTRYRRGYMLAHRGDTGTAQIAPSGPLTPADQAALDAYNELYARLRHELDGKELDAALTTLLGLPSVAEMQSDAGRFDAATIMLLRQRERLRMSGGATDLVTTTDDTAASAHVEFESRYNQALETAATIDAAEFAVLVHLDTQFGSRFQDYQSTVSMVSEIAGTVAAVVAAAVVIIASGGTATAAAPGVIAWLAANSTLIATSAAASALAQIVASEVTGGDFNEAIGADGARQALSGAINGALAVCGAALAERAATLVGLSGRALTAQIARSAASATETSVAGRAFARGALTGLIDGSLSGAVGDLAMTLTDAETWRRSVWDVLARAGGALVRGGLLGGVTGAAAGGLLEAAQGLLRARALRNVAVSMDESLGLRAAIDFTIEESGGISGLTLRFGPQTTDGDLAAHVERIAVIQRASRVLSRARQLATTSGHAQQEVTKIESMIQDRLRQLKTGLSPETRQVIDAELDVLQANLDEFSRVAGSGDAALGAGHIGRPDAPPGYPEPPAGHYYRKRGDGWDLQLYPDMEAGTPRFTLEDNGEGGWRLVSRDSLGAAPAPRFPHGTTPDQAFDQLTSPDSRSSFKQYWEMLRDNRLATRDEVVAAMLAPGDRTEDSVRHALKQAFEARVLDRTMRTADGIVLDEAQSMLELRRLTQNLNSSDRGNLTEAWYFRRHDGIAAHPRMTRDANPGVEGRGGRGVRSPDFVDDKTLVEVKSTRIGLGPEEHLQIDDNLSVALAGGTVTLEDGTVRTIDSVRVVFTDIRGARGSADKLTRWLRGRADFTLEVFGRNGASQRITRENFGNLLRDHGVDSLEALLGAL